MPKAKASASCHPDRPLRGFGLCESCYGKKYRLANAARRKVIRSAYEHANRDAHSHRNHVDNLSRKYGITVTQWAKMFERQAGQCPICLRPIYARGNTLGKRAAAVDHDHGASKRVRGLLCFRCNRYKVGTNTAETARRVLVYLTSTFDGRTI